MTWFTVTEYLWQQMTMDMFLLLYALPGPFLIYDLSPGF
jgi:hypothetical protein